MNHCTSPDRFSFLDQLPGVAEARESKASDKALAEGFIQPLVRQGRFEEAEIVIQNRLNEKFSAFWAIELARVFNLQGCPGDAREVLRKVLASGPDFTAAFVLAGIEAGTGSVEETVNAYAKALQCASDDQEKVKAIVFMCRYLMDHGHTQEAQEILEDVISRTPQVADARYSLGKCRMIEGDYHKAMIQFELARIGTWYFPEEAKDLEDELEVAKDLNGKEIA